MRIFTLLFLIALLSWGQGLQAQDGRYVAPVFDEVEVSAPQGLAFNYTVMPWVGGLLNNVPGLGSTIQPLAAQFYTPKGDTVTNRPLVIYLHTGNFIPYDFNGSCGGTLRDSSNVEIATRLAEMGYVVAVVLYRQGWLPTIEQELLKRYTLINAAYRGVQDVNTYIRYFNRSVAELGNPHGIDPDKIVVWGQGTGGYLSLASGFLDRYEEILNTSDPNKFRLPVPNVGFVPMVTENYNGTIQGDGPVTVSDAGYIPTALLGFKSGDTLSVPNHVGFTGRQALTVNMGGALGDSTWINAGEPPLISFHVETDPFAPCQTAVLRVPTARGPENVVEVSGSCDVAPIVDRLGINDIFDNIPEGRDPYGAVNKTSNKGFFVFQNTPDDSSAPWEWTFAETPKPGQLPNDCNTDANIAKTYIDTIIGYYAPRACVALGLDCWQSSTRDLTEAQVNLKLAPNPASLAVQISVSEETPVRSYAIYDISGRMVRNVTQVDASFIELQRESLHNGLYVVRLHFDQGIISKKIIFE